MSEPVVLRPSRSEPSARLVVAASALGAAIEWYDFYLYAVLAVFLAPVFFPSGDPTAQLLAAFATFGAGFVIRPVGALVFGPLGDRTGRKVAFLATVTLMGLATVGVAFLPTYAQIGLLAPAGLVVLRLLQGLAMGGEYGGAAIYVGEHAPEGRRGLHTSWISATATVGLFCAIAVILLCRLALGDEAFGAWGWRIPFGLSGLLVFAAVLIRTRLDETPAFRRARERGRLSRAPVRESLTSRANVRLMLVAMFGVIAGGSILFNAAFFVTLTFMTLPTSLGMRSVDAYLALLIALAAGTPLFVVAGALSDRVGRRPVILAGIAGGAVTLYPAHLAIAALAGPVPGPEPGTFVSASPDVPGIALVILGMCAFAAMAYGPMAAYLAEFFPLRIRYTSLSVPYHVATGWFGGWLPFVSAAITAATGSPYAGLAYPIGVGVLSLAIGARFAHETLGTSLEDDAGAPRPV